MLLDVACMKEKGQTNSVDGIRSVDDEKIKIYSLTGTLLMMDVQKAIGCGEQC